MWNGFIGKPISLTNRKKALRKIRVPTTNTVGKENRLKTKTLTPAIEPEVPTQRCAYSEKIIL